MAVMGYFPGDTAGALGGPSASASSYFGSGVGWMQVGGAISSAIGSYYSMKSQQVAISAQAQLDTLNARSSALALTGQADLDMVNARAQADMGAHNADMSMLGAQSDAESLRSSAAINAAKAVGSIASLNTGAAIDDNNVQLYALEAQSTLLHGQWEEQADRMKMAQAKSKVTTRLAAGGIDLAEGSALAVRTGFDLMAENDAIQIQQKALMVSFGQSMQAENSSISAASKRGQAGSISATAAMETAFAESNAKFMLANATAGHDYADAMLHAGLTNAQSAHDYKTTMAKIMVDNAAAAGLVKSTLANNMNPGLGAFTSLLNSASTIGSNYYMMMKTTDGVGTSQSTGKVN